MISSAEENGEACEVETLEHLLCEAENLARLSIEDIEQRNFPEVLVEAIRANVAGALKLTMEAQSMLKWACQSEERPANAEARDGLCLVAPCKDETIIYKEFRRQLESKDFERALGSYSQLALAQSLRLIEAVNRKNDRPLMIKGLAEAMLIATMESHDDRRIYFGVDDIVSLSNSAISQEYIWQEYANELAVSMRGWLPNAETKNEAGEQGGVDGKGDLSNDSTAI